MITRQHIFDINKDVFRGSVARARSLVTKAELHGSMYRRLFQDVYVSSNVPVTHELRCRGAALIAPPQAVLTGRSAATVRGLALAKPYDRVEFAVSEKHRFGPLEGIRVRRTEVHVKETHAWQGIRIARSARIAMDLLLRHSPRKQGWTRRLRVSVPDLDAFLRSGHVRRGDLIRFMKGRHNRGIVLARQAVVMSDERAESLPESELRVILHRSKILVTPQYTVHKNGQAVGRLDLCLKKHKLAIEYDDTPDQRPKNRDHRERLSALGWRFVVITKEHLHGPWQDIINTVRAALTIPA